MVGGWKECQWGVGGSYWSRPAHRFGDITMEGADTLEYEWREGVLCHSRRPPAPLVDDLLRWRGEMAERL